MSYSPNSIGNSVVKNLPANAGDMGLTPGSRRSPGEVNGNPVRNLAWEIPWTEEPGRVTVHGIARNQAGLGD